jgi:hypothetical protein
MIDQQDDAEQGQVSEVTSLDPDAADTPISDADAVAGQPGGESGEVQEEIKEAGPNARSGSPEQEKHY